MFLLRFQIKPQLVRVTRRTQRACEEFIGTRRQFVKVAPLAQPLKLATAPCSSCWEHIVRKYTEQSAKLTSASCWSCEKITQRKNQMLCMECGHLQDVDTGINFFELLDFPQKFDIEPQKLTRHFRQLQAFVHPDKYSNKSEREQNNSAEWSSLINKAYKTLAAPIERGQYLLRLNGKHIPKDNSVLDKEFLMEMMERNEEVEDASTIDDLKQLEERIIKDMKTEVEKLNTAFVSSDLNRAIAIIVKMKYLQSLQKSIKTKQQNSMG